MSIQNELGNSNEAGLTELARGQVLSPKVESLDSLDSIDSMESLDSLDSLDSLGPTHSSNSPLSLLSLYLSPSWRADKSCRRKLTSFTQSTQSTQSSHWIHSTHSTHSVPLTLPTHSLLSLSLSLKRVYLYRKLIILNEKNKSALNG
jgi:hypothetical protein